MRLPNGYGSVHKLPGNRRKPWRARKTVGWENDMSAGISRQQYITIGYYSSRKEALQALADYNENPYTISAAVLTFSEVYEKWSADYFPTLGNKSSIRTITAAYRYCTPLYALKMRDIRVEHLEQTIRNADVGDATKLRIKSLFNLMYKYALKHDIVQKDYAALCDGVKRPRPQILRVPFSDSEIRTLWDNISFPFVDMVLIGIYSGFRPQELAVLKVSDIDLTIGSMVGGLKTDAGRNRTVPIHPHIMGLVSARYADAVDMGSEYLFNDCEGQQGTSLTYDKYRGRFGKVMKRCGMDHKPHDTRHTFITLAKASGMNEYILKLIVGHEIQDVTEKVYTHRTFEDMLREISKIQ